MPSTLQRSDYEDCLIVFYFGRGSNEYLSLCIRRAYGDLKRTLRGIKNLPCAKEARNRAYDVLGGAFATIREMKDPTQERFDKWHKNTCQELCETYKRFIYKTFSVGHGQKWINMTLKYIYVMGDQRVAGFSQLYDLCHAPIDRYFVQALEAHKFPRLPNAWSKLDNYDIYLERQRWLRKHFKAPLLDVEFRLWMGQVLPIDSEPAE